MEGLVVSVTFTFVQNLIKSVWNLKWEGRCMCVHVHVLHVYIYVIHCK